MSRPILFHKEEAWTPHATSRQPVGDETKVRVQFKGGHIAKHEYLAKQLIWKQRGWAFDIAAYQIVDGTIADASTWTPTSGGY